MIAMIILQEKNEPPYRREVAMVCLDTEKRTFYCLFRLEMGLPGPDASYDHVNQP